MQHLCGEDCFLLVLLFRCVQSQMMLNLFLTRLCNTSIVVVLTEWIEIGDLTVLDTSLCNKIHRDTFLSIVSGPNFVHEADFFASLLLLSSEYFAWLLLRSVKVKQMKINKFIYKMSTSTVLEACANSSTKLQYLEMKYSPNLMPILSVLSNNIFSLNLSHSDSFLTDKKMTVTLNKLTGIHKLNISNCNELTDNLAAIIADRCPGLTHFNNSFTNMTDETTRILVKTCGCNLEEILLSHKATDQSLILIAQSCPHLTSLDISCCTNLTDQSLTNIAMNCHKLTLLDVSHCKLLTDVSLLLIAEHCPNLQRLTLVDCVVTDALLLKLAECNDHKLVKLFITRAIQLTDVGFVALAKRTTQLKHLCLDGCVLITDIAVLEFAQHCRVLNTFSVSDCPLVTDTSLLTVIANCAYLRRVGCNGTQASDAVFVALTRGFSSLDIRVDSDLIASGDYSFANDSGRFLHHQNVTIRTAELPLTTRTLRKIALQNPLLHTLTLFSCENVTDYVVLCIAQACPMLHTLYLVECGAITCDVFEIVLTNCVHLVAFEISQLDDLTDCVVNHFIENRPHLHTLGVSHCDQLSDVFLIKLSEKCAHLKHLNIQGCESCTDEGLLEVLHHNKKLTHLNISYCSFSNDILHELTQITHSLRTLKMVSCYEHEEVVEFLMNNQNTTLEVIECCGEEEEEVRSNVGY